MTRTAERDAQVLRAAVAWLTVHGFAVADTNYEHEGAVADVVIIDRGVLAAVVTRTGPVSGRQLRLLRQALTRWAVQRTLIVGAIRVDTLREIDGELTHVRGVG